MNNNSYQKIKEIEDYEIIIGNLYRFNKNLTINSLINNMIKNKDELEKKLNKYQNLKEEYSSKISEKEKQIENYYKKNFDQMQKKLREYEAENKRFANMKIDLERKIECYKNDTTKLKEDIKVYQDKIKNLKNDPQKQIENYKKENNELKENLKAYEEEANDKIKNFKNKEKQIENYKKENDELKVNIKEYQDKNKNLKNDLEKQIKNSQKEINELKVNLKSSELENSEIKNKINKKEKEIEAYKNIKSKELENSEIKNRINEQEKEIETYKNENNQLKEKLKLNEKENCELKNLNDELKKKIEEQNNNFSGILREFEKNSKSKELLIQTKNELKNKENENEKLKKTYEDLLNNMSTKKEYLENELQNFYDVVIEIDSINKLKKSGWKINYNDARKEVYNKIIEQETIKIGVLGLNNVGKSFILSLISGIKNIPTGWSIETKGISIKYTEGEKTGDNNICLLDSAGFETPLLLEDIEEENNEKKKNNKNEEIQDEINKNISIIERLSEISRDKSQTERFIEELIISLSDMLILVVGKLTRREQNLISRIKTIYKDKEKDSINFKSIIIIHNLAQYCTILEVNNHIKQVLEKSATFKLRHTRVSGIDKYSDREFYFEEDLTDHYFMARQGSEAGNYYNDLTIELIKRKYNECKSRKKLDIPKEIIDLFSKMSKDIIEDDINMNNIEISEDRKIIALKNKESNNNKIKNNKDKIKCQTIYIDEMGNYNSISSKYIPKYSYYAYKEKDNYVLLINIEIPGQIENLTASFFKYAKKKTILIKGSKKRDQLNYSSEPILIKDNRSYDEDFRFYLELDPDIELIRENPYGNTDVYKFEFNKKNKNKNEDDDMEEEEDDKEIIASGVYIIKFLITQSSWKNINRKYNKDSQKKEKKRNNNNNNNSNINNNMDNNNIDNNNIDNDILANEGKTKK